MVATTDQKARLFDLIATVSEFVRDGKRDPGNVCAVLQIVKDQPDFLTCFLRIGLNRFPVSVDYDRSVEDGVLAGDFEWDNPDLTSANFSTDRRGKAEVVVELFHLSHFATRAQAFAVLDVLGYRPIDLWELLAFGEAHPHVQHAFPIVALGSVPRQSHGQVGVPVLQTSTRGGRILLLNYTESGWPKACGIAAIRK